MSLGWSGQWRTSAMGTRTWSVNSQCSEPASLRLWLTVPVQSQHGIPKQQQKKHKKPSLPLPPHSFLWKRWGAILQLCAGSDLQAGSSSLRTLYLRDAGCLGRTITELVMKQKRHFFQKGNATALLNCFKKKKIEEEHQVRLGAAVQSMVLTCKLSKQKRVWMETWYQRSWIFFDFGSSYSFVSEFRFSAESFLLLLFPQWLSRLLHFSQLCVTPEQVCAHRKQWKQLVTSSGRGGCALCAEPWWRYSLEKQLRARCGRDGASVEPHILIGPTEGETGKHLCASFPPALSLARQKAEWGWKSQCQEPRLCVLCFHLVWYWHSME